MNSEEWRNKPLPRWSFILITVVFPAMTMVVFAVKADSVKSAMAQDAGAASVIPYDSLYWYKAEVVKIVDADTVDLDVELGFNVRLNGRFRLFRIDAWETRGDERPKGLAAKEWLEAALPLGTTILIRTVKMRSGEKKGKYGRWLADLFYNGVCLNDELVKLGHAEYSDY